MPLDILNRIKLSYEIQPQTRHINGTPNRAYKKKGLY